VNEDRRGEDRCDADTSYSKPKLQQTDGDQKSAETKEGNCTCCRCAIKREGLKFGVRSPHNESREAPRRRSYDPCEASARKS
jgi:hypothetical protein